MPPLQTSALGAACRLFLEAAYPAGPDSLPAAILRFWNIQENEPLASYLADPICQPRGERQISFRLGSARYPHMKLKVQLVDVSGSPVWVFAVDTHDAFRQDSPQPPPDHPDAAAWYELQGANRALKERIEASWEAAGLSTLNSLLREALAQK
jgi:hypothetical protein